MNIYVEVINSHSYTMGNAFQKNKHTAGNRLLIKLIGFKSKFDYMIIYKLLVVTCDSVCKICVTGLKQIFPVVGEVKISLKAMNYSNK